MEKEHVPNDKDFPIPDEEIQVKDNEVFYFFRLEFLGLRSPEGYYKKYRY
jgi:hypothetical protein